MPNPLQHRGIGGWEVAIQVGVPTPENWCRGAKQCNVSNDRGAATDLELVRAGGFHILSQGWAAP
jgi:hypothetical protein